MDNKIFLLLFAICGVNKIRSPIWLHLKIWLYEFKVPNDAANVTEVQVVPLLKEYTAVFPLHKITYILQIGMEVITVH